jgi:hypothetical protein
VEAGYREPQLLAVSLDFIDVSGNVSHSSNSDRDFTNVREAQYTEQRSERGDCFSLPVLFSQEKFSGWQ